MNGHLGDGHLDDLDDLEAPAAPLRLRSDESAGLVGALSDEAALDRGYDAGRGRARLLAAIAALPPAAHSPPAHPPAAPAASGWGGLAGAPAMLGGVVAVALTVLAGGWYLQTPADVPPPAAIERPAAHPVDRGAPVAAVERRAPDPLPAAPPIEPERAEARGTRPPAPLVGPVTVLPTVPPEPEPAPIPADGVGADGVAAVEAPAPAPASSALQAEYEEYLIVDALYQDGDLGRARDAYLGFIARHPQGTMEPEAQFGLLLTFHRLGDAVATERQAAAIQNRAVFSSRRSEILRLRAESLVVLDRCDDALALASEMASKDATEVKRACRSKR
jgi:hypothetical protein